MKNELIQKLTAVITALNNVSVNGKLNLMNMSGSISLLEDIITSLQNCDITVKTADENEQK